MENWKRIRTECGLACYAPRGRSWINSWFYPGRRLPGSPSSGWIWLGEWVSIPITHKLNPQGLSCPFLDSRSALSSACSPLHVMARAILSHSTAPTATNLPSAVSTPFDGPLNHHTATATLSDGTTRAVAPRDEQQHRRASADSAGRLVGIAHGSTILTASRKPKRVEDGAGGHQLMKELGRVLMSSQRVMTRDLQRRHLWPLTRTWRGVKPSIA